MRGTSIGTKLAIAFGFLIVILIGVGWLGLSRMNQVDSDLQDILNRHWAKVELARQLEFYENQNNQIAMDIVLLGRKQDPGPLVERRNHNAAIVKGLTASLDSKAQAGKERELFEKVGQAKVPFVNSFRTVMALAAQDKTDEAQRVMIHETMPLRENFYTAREALMQFEEAQLNAARSASQTNYAEAREIAIALICLAIGLAIAIAAFVTIAMTREVAQREQAKAAIRTLNESLERKVAMRTEELDRAIQKLQSEVNERSEIEKALRLSENNFRSLVENSPYGIMRVTPDHKILQANRALLDILGYASEQELVGLDTSVDVFQSAADHRRVVELYEGKLEVKGVEVEWKRKDGAPITVRYGRHSVTNGSGKLLYKEIIVEDITEKRIMEQQLRQGQKMEAVGRLAGGVAHDFNNLLGVIIGYSELLADQVGASGPLRAQVEQIKKAGDRASSLTRQLLAFSRQQVLETRVLSLNSVVMDMQKMLPRLIGEDVEILSYLEPKLGNVKADQGQIEQVIMNLVVNARDAMPAGGRLVLKTTNVTWHRDHHGERPGMIPGEYVLLSVADTGMGMDAQTLAHIFEPFFTTKGRGQGTGLGLATVYGVIKQSGGYIWADSAPGRGSTFEVYLPRVSQAAETGYLPEASWVPGRCQTILLVEDEESLRKLTRTILEQAGYKVLEASDGRQAIEIAQQNDGAIDLVLTDVVMPGMNGRVMAEHLTSRYPKTKVIFLSGYTDFAQHVLAGSSVNFLQKPCSREVLLRKLNEVLETGNEPNPDPDANRDPVRVEA